MSELFVGTSGWSYSAWKGLFYPPKLPAAEMLPYYAERFNTVEINNSFYRMPSASVIARWAESVPSHFRFAFKAPGEITHRRRLVAAEAATAHFLTVLSSAGEHLGPVLFQMPPTARARPEILGDFLRFVRESSAPTLRLAFEFRHPSWFSEPVFDTLSAFGASLCLTQTDDETGPLRPAGGFAYLRLRKTDYAPGELEGWRARIEELLHSDTEVYCYLKHEDSARGPAFAMQILGA